MNNKILLKTALLTSAIAVSQAFAQETEDTSDVSKGFEVILVNAQRTVQNLQEVPVSIQAVSGAELQEKNINELTQLTLAAPSLQMGQDNTFAIRGIGSQIFAETIDPSVALAIDGVSLGRNALAGQPFNDIAAVEVLNGPQGLLFGKNASAGLVNITTQKPILDETSGSLGLEYNLRDTTPNNAIGKIVKGIVNVPVSDNSALRLNLLYSDQDSLIENVYDNSGVRTDLDQKKSGIKAKYLYESGPLNVYLIADYNENKGTGERFARTFRELGEGSELFEYLDADNIVPGPENMTNNSDGTMFSDVETGGLQGEVSYLLDNGMQLINIAAWRYFKNKQNLHSDFNSKPDVVNQPGSNDYDQFSNELRLVFAKNDNYSGQMGLFYFTAESDMSSVFDVQGPPPFVAIGFPFCVGAEVEQGPPPACSVSNDVFLGSDSVTNLKQESYAAFGQFDFYLSDDLTVTAGARVTHDDVSTDVLQSQRNYFVSIGGPRGRFQESVDNTNLSWKLGLQYDVADDMMLYGSVGQGYKAPGFNTDNKGSEEIPFAVQEEVSTTIEVGLRSSLLEDNVIFNVSLFNTEFDNYQAQSFNLDAQSFIIQNAATVISRGAEISLRAILTDNLSVYWNTALLDSTFDSFDAASCTPNTAKCSAGQSFYDAAGSATPMSADVTSTLQAKYEKELTSSIYGFVNASVYYRSDMNFEIDTPMTQLDAFTSFNISAGFSTDDGLRVSLFCNNCTDEKTPTSISFDAGDNALDPPVASTKQAWGLNSVRSIGLSVTQEF